MLREKVNSKFNFFFLFFLINYYWGEEYEQNLNIINNAGPICWNPPELYILTISSLEGRPEAMRWRLLETTRT